MAGGGFTIGDWCWFTRQASPCRVIERQDVWGEVAYRVWLPAKDAVVRARAVDLASLESVRPSVEQILHTTAAAKLLDALEDNLLLAPIQSSVVPLPHQLYALNRAMSQHRIRYLLADEVGLGKTLSLGTAALTLCLLADRDLTRRGVEVEFFGEQTRMPAGPAPMTATRIDRMNTLLAMSKPSLSSGDRYVRATC